MADSDPTPKPAALAAQEKLTRAIDMRKRYATWQQVADECGWSDRSTAYNAVNREMARRREALAENVDDLREREVERLDLLAARALQVLETPHFVVSAGKLVDGPDGFPLLDDGPVLAAATTLVRISESYRRLHGLDAAQKVEAAVSVQFTINGVPEEEMP